MQLDSALDLEDVLSIEHIRQHTQTDDIEHVDDGLIALYREAAFEAAEKYTGQIWTQKRSIVENVQRPRHKRGKIRLSHPAVDGRVAARSGRDVWHATTRPGSRIVNVPLARNSIQGWNCCDPCGVENDTIEVTYTTGVDCVSAVPTGIKLGVLKFIAWSIENPGDELLATATPNAQPGSVSVTTHGAFLSGAIEQWRMYLPSVSR